MEDRVFGDAGQKVVIEEFLVGQEVSMLAFTDGKTIKTMVSSQDHKRALDNDRGLNTGEWEHFLLVEYIPRKFIITVWRKSTSQRLKQ